MFPRRQRKSNIRLSASLQGGLFKKLCRRCSTLNEVKFAGPAGDHSHVALLIAIDKLRSATQCAFCLILARVDENHAYFRRAVVGWTSLEN